MSGERAPWWYSGGEDAGAENAGIDDAGLDEARSEEAPDADAGSQHEQDTPLDWTALALGAQRLVDWAAERLLTPHAEHADPREHPTCVVCRTQLLLGEAGSPADPATTDEAAATVPSGSAAEPTVEWIPIVE